MELSLFQHLRLPPVDPKVLKASNYQLSKDRKTVTFDRPLATGKSLCNRICPTKEHRGQATRLPDHLLHFEQSQTGKGTTPGKKRRSWNRNDKSRPIPPVVSPLPSADCFLAAPKNAIVLDASQWTNADWKFDDTGVMPRGKGNNLTKQSFGDARIHLEFRFEPSDNPEWKGQLYGNSGIFLMSGYELQVVNSFQNPTFADGACGSIYGQHPPRVNASRKPGEWQAYDILMKAPVFSGKGEVEKPVARHRLSQRNPDSRRRLDLRRSRRTLQKAWKAASYDSGPQRNGCFFPQPLAHSGPKVRTVS